MAYDIDRMRALVDRVAVVGVGDTNYGEDYREGGAARRRGAPGAKNAYAYAAEALTMALEESGLEPSDIDGVMVSGDIHREVTCELFGLQPTWQATQPYPDTTVSLAVMAIMAGHCKTVAMIKGTTQRADNAQFGGTQTRTARLGETYSFPWGFNSQGAQHALMWRHYLDAYHRREEELFAVPFNARRAASRNPKAVFRTPMTFEEWWNSGYIAEPLRRLDYTIINDGGSCIILRRADMLSGLKQHPVLVNGFSWSTAPHASGLMDRVADNYYTIVSRAANVAYEMARIGPKDVDQFQVYDAFSDILVWSLEACGFAPRGEALDFMGENAENIDVRGELPCMTSGGHQSEAYLLGWTQLVEAIRQARHDFEGTDRQIPDCNQTFYVHPSAEGPHTVLFHRG